MSVLEDLYTFYRRNFMAKRKMATRRSGTRAVPAAKRGVPTLEEVHDCREELKFPQYVVLGIERDDCDPEDYEEGDASWYWRDCTFISQFFNTEEEAIKACKESASNRYNTAEYKIMKLHLNVKATRLEPVLEIS